MFAKQNTREGCASIVVEATELPLGMILHCGSGLLQPQRETQEQKGYCLVASAFYQ